MSIQSTAGCHCGRGTGSECGRGTGSECVCVCMCVSNALAPVELVATETTPNWWPSNVHLCSREHVLSSLGNGGGWTREIEEDEGRGRREGRTREGEGRTRRRRREEGK